MTAPPQSQVCVICVNLSQGLVCWTGSALGLLRCNAGSGCFRGWLGICMALVSRKRIFRYPRKPYGEMTSLWGSAVTYGEMRQACGCMGKPRYRMGRRPMCGEAAESHGERKSHEKPEYGSGRRRLGMGPPDRMGSLSQWQTWRDLRTLHIFATTGSAARAWAPPD